MAKIAAKSFVQVEPVRDVRSSLSMPKLGGSEQCRTLVSAYGGIHRVAEDFQIDPNLLNRYLTGQIEPPYSFLVALYWHTDYGFKQAFSEAHWTHQYNTFRYHQADEKCKALERVVQHAIALLEHRADAADLLREALQNLAPSSHKYPSGVTAIPI